MKSAAQSLFMVMVSVVVFMAAVSTASASEVVTVNHAKGGNYSIVAYNLCTKSYYYLTGTVGSDSYQISVPNGYSSSLTVAVGRRVGTRNLYAECDPYNPIFDVINKSTYVLELRYIGRGSSTKAMGSVTTDSVPDALFGGEDTEAKRFPPQ